MKILGVLLAFVGFALGIYEIINTLRGKENKRILCGVAIAYLGYGVCYSVSQKDLGYLGCCIFIWVDFLCNKSYVRSLEDWLLSVKNAVLRMI